MSKVDWSKRHDSTHVDPNTHCFYKKVGGKWMLHLSGERFTSSSSLYNGEADERNLIERPKPKPWSGPEDGLPPVGLEIEARIDFKKAPPYTIINLTELGVDVQRHTPRFQKAKVLYVSNKYLITEASGVECLAPMSCVELRAVRVRNDARETAIRELMDIAQVDCRVTAARLVDAGFKREVV